MKRASGFFLVALLLVASPAFAWPPHGGFHHGAFHHPFAHRFAPRFPGRSIVIGRPWWGNTFWLAPGWGYAYAGPYPYIVGDSFDAYYAPYVVYPPTPMVFAPPSKPYWYYCASAQEYYPQVKTCPEAWIKVPPTPQ